MPPYSVPLVHVQGARTVLLIQSPNIGMQVSPQIFDNLSKAIAWIAHVHHNYGIGCILYLLDDFLTIDYPHAEAEDTMARLICFFFTNFAYPLFHKRLSGLLLFWSI